MVKTIFYSMGHSRKYPYSGPHGGSGNRVFPPLCQGGIRVNLTPKMRQGFQNTTPRSSEWHPKNQAKYAKYCTSTIYAGTRPNLRSHASTPRISKLHAEDLRRDIHRFHPGLCGHPRTTEVHVNLKFFCTTPRMAQISTVGYRSFLGRPNSYAHL